MSFFHPSCFPFLCRRGLTILAWLGALMITTGKTTALPMSQLLQSAPEERTYKTTGNASLKLFYFTPDNIGAEERRPAVVWIHGGGWTGGILDGFMPHARYCAARGAIGVNIAYRLASPEGFSLRDCVADCKSALRYLRAHAAELKIDPERIAVAGDSAGGHLAACLGTLDGFDDPGDDLATSARPNAMLLYNPIVDLTDRIWIRFAIGGATMASNQPPAKIRDEDLEAARSLSPLFHVRKGQPPTLLMHGYDDQIVAWSHSQEFADAMKKAGNRCDLILLPKTDHAFAIAFWQSPELAVVNTLRESDRFLATLGYFQGEPTIEVSQKPAW